MFSKKKIFFVHVSMYCSTYSTVQLLLHNISTNQLSELPTANVLRLALEALRRGTVISFHTSIFHCFWCVVTKFRLLHYYLGWWQFGEKKWNWTFRSIYLVILTWIQANWEDLQCIIKRIFSKFAISRWILHFWK